MANCITEVTPPGTMLSFPCSRRAVADEVSGIPSHCTQHSADAQDKRDQKSRDKWAAEAAARQTRHAADTARRELVQYMDGFLREGYFDSLSSPLRQKLRDLVEKAKQ